MDLVNRLVHQPHNYIFRLSVSFPYSWLNIFVASCCLVPPFLSALLSGFPVFSMISVVVLSTSIVWSRDYAHSLSDARSVDLF